jgi:hypothetical protein
VGSLQAALRSGREPVSVTTSVNYQAENIDQFGPLQEALNELEGLVVERLDLRL